MKKVNKIQKGIFFIGFFIGIWCLPICSKEAYAATEIELLKTAISHLKEDVVELENQVNTHIQNDSTTDGRDGVDGKDGKDGVNGKDGTNGKDGVGISKIEKTGTNGNVDTYSISLTDGTVYDFTVTNGVNGKDGANGKDGIDGVDGQDGLDGKDGVDGKNAVIDTEPKKENGSTMGVVATAMASVSLLGNIVLTTFLLKKKKN